MTHDQASRAARLRPIAVALGLVLPMLAGCAADGTQSTAATPTQQGLAHLMAGDLNLTDGYIPQPASPDVAAAYITIANNGTTPTTLTTVTSTVSDMVMPMNESTSNGVGRMSNLPAVQIAPHSSFSFAPGRAHLMLEKPNRALRAGDRVPMSLTFSGMHPIRIDLPVVPAAGP